MFTMRNAKRVLVEEEGAALVEYGLLVGLIALACVLAIGRVGDAIKAAFEAIADALEGIDIPAPP